MICPKCKKEISDKILRCNHCNFKVATLCKFCGAYNSIYNEKCIDCGKTLIKFCPKCNSANFPEAKKCRKCGFEFSDKEITSKKEKITDIEEIYSEQVENGKFAKDEEKNIHFKITNKTYSQGEAKDELVKALGNKRYKVIGLCGDKGSGKTTILKTAFKELQEIPLIFLLGKCDAFTQLSPFGYIQSLFFNFFNLANFTKDVDLLRKESLPFFKSEFPNLSIDEISDLFNFLYPKKTAFYEEIYINKEKTFNLLMKVFDKILSVEGDFVFIVEDFDLIDGMSFAFLLELIKKKNYQNLKLLITFSQKKSILGYFYDTSDLITEHTVLDIRLGSIPHDKKEILLKQYPVYEILSQEMKNTLLHLSPNPAIMEQVLYLLTENDGEIDFEKNNTFESIVKTRLELLKAENPNAYHVLLASSIMGIKFYPFSLAQIFSLEDNEINKIMKLLKEKYYVEEVNEFSFEFKNSTLWNTILKEARTDEDFAQINQKIYEFLYDYTFSSKAVLAIVASDLNQKLSAFEIWTENVKLAAYIGDINFYVISQKQCLKLLDELIGVDSVLIKTNIYERLSKILSDLKPNQAMEYLPTVIDNAQKNGNLFKEIDLLGYLAKVCAILEKPYGIIECVDEVDRKIGEGFELEKALIKAKKLDALFLIGNVGELITIAENEVLPPIEKSLNSGAKSPIIFEIWIKTLYTLANAFTLQGNNQGIQVIARIFEIFEKNKIENESFTNKLKLTLAFAYSIKGDFLSSDTILEEFIKNVDDKKLDNECVLRWNLTNIYNRFLKRDYKNLQEDLFQLVTFANNVNDHFSKNILKTLLGKLLKEDYAPDKARDIFEEQVTYFAKEKNATGALLSWYWIAEITLSTKGPKKAIEIAQKALDVAQNPKINNYYFIALFNKLMAECYLVLFDYEAVKIHLEKAVLIAKKFQLLELLTRLYLIYSKYLQDLAAETSDTQMDYLTSVLKMNKKALAIAETLKSPVLVADVAKSEATLNSFCKLNNIKLIDTDV